MIDPTILDDLFHGCAFAAFVEVAQQQQGWPEREAVRQLAYRDYEKAKRNNQGGQDVA